MNRSTSSIRIQTHIGAYCAWSWGVSRLIDGLEHVQKDLPIDLKHLAITVLLCREDGSLLPCTRREDCFDDRCRSREEVGSRSLEGF